MLPRESRDALQAITHLLTPEDGLGHGADDGTAQGLIRESRGADSGDEHERLMAQAMPKFAEHPELAQ